MEREESLTKGGGLQRGQTQWVLGQEVGTPAKRPGLWVDFCWRGSGDVGGSSERKIQYWTDAGFSAAPGSRATTDLLLPLLQQQAELVELVYTGGQPEGQRAGEDTPGIY